MTGFSNLTIYYHSGTGNALQAARWMSDFAEQRSIENTIVSIDHKQQANKHKRCKNTLLGFHYPTHGFNLSPAMLKFIWKFPKSNGEAVYLLNTRAGGKFFKWFIPGLSGIAQILPMFILWLKKYTIIGGYPLDLPSNWISVHPGLGPNMVSSIIIRRKHYLEKFAEQIFEGKKNFLRMLALLPIDLLVSPIAFLYYLIGRFFLAKTFVHTHKCTDCNLCVDNCPVNAIKIVDGKPYWSYRCESCMRCINICPHKAIQSSHLLFFGGILLYQIGGSYFLFSHFEFLDFLRNDYVIFLIDSVIVLVSFFLIYRLLHLVFKTKWFGRILELTSLTHYWRRYLFPGTKVKDFKG